MDLLFRTLLIWLLVLAIPAQGAAAAAMAFCGPNHHDGGATAGAQQLPAEAHTHAGVEAQTAHEHRAMATLTTLADVDVSASATSAAPAKAAHAEEHKCSACAACCSVGAILNTVLSVPAPEPAVTVFFALVTNVDAFVAVGPERPPRTILA